MVEGESSQQPVKDTTLTFQCPILTSTNYTIWKMRMEVLLGIHEVWDVVDPGSVNAKKNKIVKGLLFQSIPQDLILQIGNLKTGKEMWEAIKTRNLGADYVKEARLQTLIMVFENLKMSDNDTIDAYAAKLSGIASKSATLREVKLEHKLVKKFLTSLPRCFVHIVAALEQVLDLKTTGFKDLVGRLKAYEERVKQEDKANDSQEKLLYARTDYSNRNSDSSRGRGRGSHSRGRGRGRGQGRGQGNSQNQGQRDSSKNREDNRQKGKQKEQRDISHIKCYCCDKFRNFVSKCQDRKRDYEANLSETHAGDVNHEEGTFFMMNCIKETIFMNEEKYTPPKNESNTDEDDVWYFDNGASNHMTGNYSYFSKLNENITGCIMFGDGSCVRIKGKGSILFQGKNGEQKLLKDIYYIPALRSNVISLGQATISGCDIRIRGDFLTMHNTWRDLLIKVPRSENRLYKAQLKAGKPYCLQANIDEESWLWHSCMVGKQTKKSFSKKATYRASRLLEMVHGDICGPITPSTQACNSYIIVLIDDCSRFCDEEGIARMLTAPYAPQQNGIVERRNCTLLEMTRTPTRALVGVTPYEKFFREKPNPEDLKVFGCVAYERIVSKHLKKLDDRSKPLVYLGKEPSSGGFWLYNPRENKIIINANIYCVMGQKNGEAKQIWNNDATIHDATVLATVNTVHNLITVHETPFYVTSLEGHEDEYESDVTPILVRRSTRNKVLPTRLVDYQLNVHELMLTLDEEPRNYNEAKLNPKLLKAMKTELESIVKNNTWKPVPLPKDFDEVFTPVAQLETIRLLIALVAGKGWKIHHLDVKMAFLHGKLKEEVYVVQPEGFEKPGEEKKVYKLAKSLYGLRQAPRAWNIKLDNTLKEMGFQQCMQEKAFKKRMASQFEMSDLGELTYYLGIEVSQGKDCVEIKQERYARKILKEAGMEDCNATSYPMEKDLKLSKAEDEPEVEATQYRKVVGCLRYLLHTRPDLTYSVGVVSRYMQSPRESHARAIKQILRYLKGTTSFGIKYNRSNDMKLVGYSDSSHNVDIDDGRSTTGHVFYLGTSPITWCSQKQTTVALSSCEAEFMAATAAACQAIWLRELLAEVTGLERQKVIVEHVSGENQRADPLTKALARIRFKEMRSLLGVQELPSSTQKFRG
ncbi:zinc finger, CCHC-type containing protein [Tanacetum coccineum]